MDIGTAKSCLRIRSAITHHLIDIVDPDDTYSLGLFTRQARSAIIDICARKSIPIVVGGTGQYIWSLLEGWQVPEVPPNTKLRRKLEVQAKSDGTGFLLQQLFKLDAITARTIDPHTVRRIIRAIEVHRSRLNTSKQPTRVVPTFHSLTIGLDIDREILYDRINKRVEKMIDFGWEEEVNQLTQLGYTADLPSMSSLGYQELHQSNTGIISRHEAITKIKTRTRRFSRRQQNWFRTKDNRIEWFESSEIGFNRAIGKALQFIA